LLSWIGYQKLLLAEQNENGVLSALNLAFSPPGEGTAQSGFGFADDPVVIQSQVFQSQKFEITR
jgi:hypothetical protein